MAIETGISRRINAWTSVEAIDWDRVFAEQMPRVYNFFRYRTGNDTIAEDLTSRTFEKAWRARRRYRKDRAGFGTWLFSIARNIAVDHMRAERRHAPLDTVAELVDPSDPAEEHARESDIARLNQLIRDLPEREQELIALKYGAEATNRAIAGLTGLSESNVGTILHRAVAELRKRW